MSGVATIKGRWVLDSRGNPTVEVDVRLESGALGPCRGSVGRVDRRARGGRAARRRRGVRRQGRRAAPSANVNGEIAVAGRRPGRGRPGGLDAALIELDGTPNKGRLGANAILGVSLAAAKAQAAEEGVSLYRSLGGEAAVTLPVPMMNVINGGVHAPNTIDLQEFMVVPAGASTFAEALQLGAEVYHALRAVLHERGLVDGGRRRGRLRARPAVERGGDRGDPRGGRPRGPARPDRDRARSGEIGGLPRRRVPLRGPGARRRRAGRQFWAGAPRAIPIVSVEDGSAEDDWEAGSG